MFSMKFHHAREINRADDIDVVQKEGFFQADRLLDKKISGLFQAAAGIEQDLLAGDRNIHLKILVAFQVVDDHSGEMMRVDNYVSYPSAAQPGERDLQQSAAGDFYQGLRPILGKWAQARTQTRGKN